MKRGHKDDYTTLSWIVTRPLTDYLGAAALIAVYTIALLSVLMPGALPVTAPLLVCSIVAGWLALKTGNEADWEEIRETASKTGWHHETTTHEHAADEFDLDEACMEPECRANPHDTVTATYAYSVFYLADKELIRKATAENRYCPEHDEQLDVDKETETETVTEYEQTEHARA